MSARRGRGGARSLALGALVCAACTEDLPPHGEVVLYVDTDLPVPRMVSRLRVDIFGRDGHWQATRDIPLSEPSDWPASFGVLSPSEDQPTEVLVRLRAYADGRTRPYRGERFHARASWVEPHGASSLEELCATLPDLAAGDTITLRRGLDVITETEFSEACPAGSGSGTVGVRVNIPERGRYRFEVVHETSGHATLWLRTTCDVGASEVACIDPEVGLGATDLIPPARLVLDLAPGSYTLLSDTKYIAQPADTSLRWTREDEWGESPPIAEAPPPGPQLPRLVVGGADLTPVDEPEPRAAVDRLVRLRIEPDRVAAAHVVLRGACLGTMPSLGPDPANAGVDPDVATTCAEVENTRAAPVVEALVQLPGEAPASLQGSYAADEPCPDDVGGDVVCVPGGVFALGGNVGAILRLTTLPERAARISRFWVDRNEATIAAFRRALAEGLELPRPPPPTAAELSGCNWTEEPGAFEDYPLACIDHDNARAYCQHRGGDLPTEAQWEYVASAAWRPFETRYPWGDERVTCDRAHFGRLSLGGTHECPGLGSGTLPVGTFAATDRTPGPGVVNLAGSLQEWTRDSAHAFDHPCWDATSLVDPVCVEETAPEYSVRGGNWAEGSSFTFATMRWSVRGPSMHRLGGMRCVYQAPP